jgi:TonB family protein
MQQLLSSLEDERQRQFRRFVAISAAVHVALGLLFWVGPIRPTGKALPVVERVELVEALTAAPTARPAPAPARPAPPKPKPPPPPMPKVLPKEPAPLPKPKPLEAKPTPKPAEAKPKPEPKPKEPEPAPEQDYEDVLAQLRDEVGQTAPPPAPAPADAAPAATGRPGGPGVVVDPETARWIREVKIHVTRAWILPAGFRTEAFITVVEVDLSPTGDVLGTRTVQSSGNPWYDESVERAIEKASPVPAPPEAGEWQFTFDSREML